MQSMDYMEVSNLCKNSVSGMDETLLIKIRVMTRESDISARDQWEGEDGFMSTRAEGEIIKESWDEEQDTCINTKTEDQANLKKEKELMIDETTQRDLKSVLNMEIAKPKRGKLQKRNDNNVNSAEEREKLEEMKRIALSRHGVKRKRKRRPFVKKKGDKMEEQLLPDGNKPETDTETVVDIRKMENAKGTEMEIEPSSSKDDLRNRNTMDVHKIGFNTTENKAQAVIDDDEDDEEDDDGFVPRKLFLFSFTHFKDEELVQNEETHV